jgi:hypothetical protein
MGYKKTVGAVVFVVGLLGACAAFVKCPFQPWSTLVMLVIGAVGCLIRRRG